MKFPPFLQTLAVCATILPAFAQEIVVTGNTAKKQPPIPITLTGYADEAEKVLKFDLYVAGFEIVSPAQAQYELKAGKSAEVQGTLLDTGNKHALFARSYPGGTTRAQAHMLSDDVVKAITGVPGIARTKIAYKAQSGLRNAAGENIGEIFVSDYDGANAFQATEDKTIATSPAWVPGQLALFYTSYRAGGPAVYSHNLSTGARTRVFAFNGQNSSAAISPDGTKVALILSKSGSPDLWVANLDGSGLRQLTHTPEPESSPCWSPDSKTICLTSTKDGRAQLYTIPASGGELRRLATGGVVNCTEPDWSPDGTQIAFTRASGEFTIYLVGAGGGDAKPITAGEDPSWAPNSRTIVFTRGRDGARRLSLLDVPTRQVKDVARLSGSCSQPSWAK